MIKMSTTTQPPIAPTDSTTEGSLLSNFSYILDNATRCATFTCGGQLPILRSPSTDESGNLTPRTEENVHDQRVLTKGVMLRWGPDGEGRAVTLPVQSQKDQAAFERLVQNCVPATFGRGGEDVYDQTYRHALAMNADEFMTDFCPYEAGIIDIITQLLLPPITGDLTSSPTRSKVMQMYELNHAQAAEIEYAIDTLGRKKGSKIDTRDVQQCLEALNVGPASAQEMLEMTGQLDPMGSMFVERDAVFELAAKRVRRRWLGLHPNAPDPKRERRKMLSRGIRAELYKLNIYSGPSGLFKPHVDTPRSEFQIGSLVVCLPVRFAGGALAVRHKSEEMVYDWSEPLTLGDSPCVQWAAFYSDCKHEVLQVTSGHRLTLTYNLFLAKGASLSTCRPSSLDRGHLPLVTNLRTMLSNEKFMSQGGYVGIHLAHRYPHTHPKLNQFVPNMLKGVDMVVYESISLLELPALLCTVSTTNLPTHGILEKLDQMDPKWVDQVSTQLACSPVNGLNTFEPGFTYQEEEIVDEENAHDHLLDYGPDGVYGRNSNPDHSDSNSEREVPEYLQKWKARFEDRKNIHWINKAQHEELSRAFLVVSSRRCRLRVVVDVS